MKLATIAYEAGAGEAADAVLRDVANNLRSRGYRLAGTVQWNAPPEAESRCEMELEDLATGRRYSTAVKGPRQAQACRLDSSALEDVAGLVASSIAAGLDLVIINRFGKQEISGAGFRAIIEAAVANEVPVLTALNWTYAKDWQAFAGDVSTILEPELVSVQAWCDDALQVILRAARRDKEIIHARTHGMDSAGTPAV